MIWRLGGHPKLKIVLLWFHHVTYAKATSLSSVTSAVSIRQWS